MSFKNAAADFTTMSVHISNARNKVGKIISLTLSIIFLIISMISFLFSWIVGLVFLGLSALFFGIYKLAKYAINTNNESIEKIQEMKETLPHEKI